MSDDNVVDLGQYKRAMAAFKLIENTPPLLGTMLMSEETLQSFEDEIPNIRDFAELVVEPEGSYWKVQLP